MCGICVGGLVPPRALTLDIQVGGGEGGFSIRVWVPPSGLCLCLASPQHSYAIVRTCRPSSPSSSLRPSPLPVQAQRFMEEYRSPRIIPPEVAKMGGVTSEMARRCARGRGREGDHSR